MPASLVITNLPNLYIYLQTLLKTRTTMIIIRSQSDAKNCSAGLRERKFLIENTIVLEILRAPTIQTFLASVRACS